MVEWTLFRDETIKEADLVDIQTTNSANPFGDYAIAQIDDVEGQAFNEYPYGIRIDAEIDDNGVIYQDFTGFVVERRETDKNGADSLEVEAYTFDQFLRKSDVTNSQVGNTISEALEDIITTDTPVSWNANNVDVVDDVELSISLKDERVETALQILAFKSGNEGFGVNDDLEFYFRPREREHIDRGISNADWFDYDLPERGKEAINEVEVRYNEGNESVVVDNPGQKLDLQDNLNLPDPGTQRARINRPEITDPKDAEDEGRRFLKFRNATLNGTVTTYGLYDASPFDTIDVEIIDRGIDDEFIITKVNKKWGRDETTLTLVENRGFDDDFIVRLSEKTERLDLRDSDPDAQEDRITSTNIAANMDVLADVGGTSESASRFVNDGLNLVRDGWKGDGNLSISDVVIGTDSSGLSRSNTSLQNQVASASATETLVGDTEVEYSATFTQTGVEEVGLLDTNGTLICRAVLETPVDLNSDTVILNIDVSNDSDVDRGVLTTLGQEATRDIVANNTPSLPEQYAYGSDNTSPVVSDTALGNTVYTTSLLEIILKSVDTTVEWNYYTEPAENEPTGVVNDTFKSLQTSFTTEGENYDRETNTKRQTDSNYSNGDSVKFTESGQVAEYDFRLNYTIPESAVGLGIRFACNNTPEIVATLNGNQWIIVNDGFTASTIGWETNVADFPVAPSGEEYSGGDLEAGEYTLRIESTTAGGTSAFMDLDVLNPYDSRFAYTFDNDNGGSSGYLDGPELYPDQVISQFDAISTRREVDEARVNSSWIDSNVDNNQFIELSNDGGNTWITTNNSETADVTFSSLNTDVDARVGLSRYGSRTTATPQTGFNGQGIDLWELFANPDAIVADGIGEANTRAIVARSTLTDGDTLREAAQLDTNGNTLSRSVFADVKITSQIQNLISSETTTFRTT